MRDEKGKRKWFFASVVTLIVWGLLSGTAVAATYDALTSTVVA